MLTNSIGINQILKIPNITCWFAADMIKGLVDKNTGISNNDRIGDLGGVVWKSLVGNSRFIRHPDTKCSSSVFLSNASLGNAVNLNNTTVGSTNTPTLMLDASGSTLYSNANNGSTTIIAASGPVNYGNGWIWNGDLAGYYSNTSYAITNGLAVANGYGFKYGRTVNFTNTKQYQRNVKFTLWTSNITTKTDELYSLENNEFNSRIDTNVNASYSNNNPASLTQNTPFSRNVFIIGPWASPVESGGNFTVSGYQGTINVDMYEFAIINRVITNAEINQIRTYFKQKYPI